MDVRLTSQDYWIGAAFAAAVSLLVGAPLLFAFRQATFQRAALATTLASALFWGVLATLALVGFWELYYQYIYPIWMRWLAPLDTLLYAVIGLGMWWLAVHLPGPPVLWFLILGGIESLLEHLVGIYALHILDKVPILQGVDPLPALIFAFFEYIVYWGLVAWLSLGMLKFSDWWRGG